MPLNSTNTEATKYTYTVGIMGGIGPDTWDKEVEVEAENIGKAAALAMAQAEEINGWVVLIEQAY